MIRVLVIRVALHSTRYSADPQTTGFGASSDGSVIFAYLVQLKSARGSMLYIKMIVSTGSRPDEATFLGTRPLIWCRELLSVEPMRLDSDARLYAWDPALENNFCTSGA